MVDLPAAMEPHHLQVTVLHHHLVMEHPHLPVMEHPHLRVMEHLHHLVTERQQGTVRITYPYEFCFSFILYIENANFSFSANIVTYLYHLSELFQPTGLSITVTILYLGLLFATHLTSTVSWKRSISSDWYLSFVTHTFLHKFLTQCALNT